MRSTSGRPAHPRFSRPGCVNGRWLVMARGEWSQARVLAGQRCTVLRRAGIGEELRDGPGLRGAGPRGYARGRCQGSAPEACLRPTPAARAGPCAAYLAVQVGIELIRVCIGLADLAGAEALMREADELIWRRPGLGTLAVQAGEFQSRLQEERG